MARQALADVAAEKAHELHKDRDWIYEWAYQAAYVATVKRLNEAKYRGAARSEEDERVYWNEVRRIADEKLSELKGES